MELFTRNWNKKPTKWIFETAEERREGKTNSLTNNEFVMRQQAAASMRATTKINNARPEAGIVTRAIEHTSVEISISISIDRRCISKQQPTVEVYMYSIPTDTCAPLSLSLLTHCPKTKYWFCEQTIDDRRVNKMVRSLTMPLLCVNEYVSVFLTRMSARCPCSIKIFYIFYYGCVI